MKNYEVRLRGSDNIDIRASGTVIQVDSDGGLVRRTLIFKKGEKGIAWFNYEDVVYWRITS